MSTTSTSLPTKALRSGFQGPGPKFVGPPLKVTTSQGREPHAPRRKSFSKFALDTLIYNNWRSGSTVLPRGDKNEFVLTLAADHSRGVTSAEQLTSKLTRLIARQPRIYQRLGQPNNSWTVELEECFAAAVPALWDAYERYLKGEMFRLEA
jgi:hypothetical protein